MLRKPPLTLALALVLAAVFCLGLTRLFVLRYETGDVYAPYSTLRADPLGAKAIHDALDELPGVDVRRNFKPLKKLQPGRPITLVYAGVGRHSMWTQRELQEFESLVLGGTRAVFAFHPIDRATSARENAQEDADAREKKKAQLEEEREKPQSGTPKPKKDAAKEDEEMKESGFISFDEVARRFGFQFDFLPPAEARRDYDRRAELAASDTPLEPKLTWHSALYFKELAPEWKVLYRSGEQPVLIERAYGRGSIVLAADSFFLSNEALRNERHPQLLSRVFAGPSPIVFDEEHLGVSDDPGIVQLALKYRLHGVIAGLALLAALFVWKNATRFLPALPDETDAGEVVAGKDSAQGFAHVLRRSIAPAELLGVCVEEWRHGAAHRDREVAVVEELAAREAARPPKQRNPVAAYRAIASALSRDTKRAK